MSTKTRGMLMLVFVNVMWGLSFIFSKTALSEGMPAMTLAFWRYVLTAVMMVPLCLKTEGGIRLGKWAPRALLTTLLGITVYFYFEYSGLLRTTASAASLILALVPMLTLLFRVVFCRERISRVRWFAVVLSLVGAYFVIMTDGSEGAGTLAGNLLMVCACLCWTGYILTTPPLMEACSSMRVSTWQAVAGAVTLCPFALAEKSDWVSVSPMAWLCIFLLAAVCSALCYVLYNDAIRFVDTLSVSLTINLNPVAACIGGALLLGETMTSLQLAGGIAIILSMVVDTLETSGVLSKKRG
ncbi:MAG: DMT family transporter [Clostridiales bacterium]|nr:DMT family transporter [Clostridiales bacterium]